MSIIKGEKEMEGMEALEKIVKDDVNELIDRWIRYFDSAEDKEEQARYYDDFLGFFEECISDNLDPSSESAGAMKLFLLKLMELMGDDYFFNFNNSVYTCFLKFPIFQLLEDRGAFHFPLVAKMTSFFESMTSRIIVEVLTQRRLEQESAHEELQEREAPISEISDGILMVVIVGTLDSNRIMIIIDKILNRMEQSEISHVIVDITAIDDMNSEIANQLIKLSNAIHFMGADALISGINANIAKRLTHLAIDLGTVKTFRAAKDAMAYIVELKK